MNRQYSMNLTVEFRAHLLCLSHNYTETVDCLSANLCVWFICAHFHLGNAFFLNEKEKSLHKLEFTIRKFIQKKKKLKRHKVLATELVAPIFFSINVQFMGFTKTIILNTNEMD